MTARIRREVLEVSSRQNGLSLATRGSPGTWESNRGSVNATIA